MHQLAEDEFDDLFETTQEEEQLLKTLQKPSIKVTGEELIDPEFKPKNPEVKYFDDTPKFESASEKYIYYIGKYKIELILLIVVFIFLFNLFIGKKINRQLAEAFHLRCIDAIKQNFAHQGLGEILNHNLHQLLFHEFEYFASGRDNCKYLMMNYVMKKRQDMFSNQVLGLIYPTEDQVFVEIGIDNSQPIEAIILKQ